MRRASFCQPPVTPRKHSLLRSLLISRLLQQRNLSTELALYSKTKRSKDKNNSVASWSTWFGLALHSFLKQTRVVFFEEPLQNSHTLSVQWHGHQQNPTFRSLHQSIKVLIAVVPAALLLDLKLQKNTKRSESTSKYTQVFSASDQKNNVSASNTRIAPGDIPIFVPLKKLRTLTTFIQKSTSSLTYPFSYTVRTYTLQVLLTLGVSSVLLSGTYVLHEDVFKDLPSASQLTQVEPHVSSKILDRNGHVLFRLFDEENRSIVSLSELPKYVVFATIAIEDKDFYDHHGFSLRGILRAFFANLESENVQGGSTITQQLVKNRLLTPERTLTRKLKEVILAVAVENEYDKNQILEMYLNQVAYGGATYGIEEAAQNYFGKSSRDLSLAEAALLAGLPQAPSVYSPFGANPELAAARQQEVLRRMAEDGYISEEQALTAAKEPLAFRDDVIDIKAPHFVMYVRKLLADTYGEELLYQGGLEVRTSLDLELQEETEETLATEVESLARLRVSNGAALITNPQTGEILTMVGSKDYFDFAHDGQVNVTTRPRQPGSSIKPLTYAVALEQGFSPGTVVTDAPITYSIPGSPPYSPKNYDGSFHGTVTLREALASSYNIPAVKTLAYIGVDSLIDTAQSMGISTWQDRKRFGLSLTLGGGEVLMTEMAQIYGTFANNGVTVPLNPILEITTYKGDVLYRNTCAVEHTNCTGPETLDPRVAYMITNMLADNAARTPAFGPFSTLNIPNQEVAVKTGTTNNLRDNWTFGYTSDRLVGVWVGNNDNTPMSYVASGVTGASSIWNTVMRAQLSETEPHHFTRPSGLVELPLCQQSRIRSPFSSIDARDVSVASNTKTELFLEEKAPAQNCIPTQFSRLPETSTKEVSKLIGGTQRLP